MLVASILVILLIPLVILVVMKYFGLKIHFGKVNSTLSKLVTTAGVLQSITETEAKTLTDSKQFHVTDLTINAIFAYEVLFILLVTYGFYKIFGNPEDIKITGKMANIYPLELEHGYLLDILSFNWNSFILNLRGMPLVLPLLI